jgi:PAS domain S-box-containing protein
MNDPSPGVRERDESPSAVQSLFDDNPSMFQLLFERSADAIWLFDPQAGVFVDCNAAAVELMCAGTKERLLGARPEDLSPHFQPDGTTSRERTTQVVALVEERGSQRFEWAARRFDGHVVPLEVLLTPICASGRNLHVVFSRDISERKKSERELLELNQSLERRVAERTAELTTSEARFRALVEHAPEAIVVFEGDTGRFLFGNEHACALYGVPMERLSELTPADVSPELQPNGRRSSELARELMAEALAGGMPVFEWTHQQQPHGRLIPTEVRLLRLPAEGQNLIRASIIDNTERKLAERALRESEAQFRALFEGASQGVVLHDEERILQVNPAAVRILGRQSSHELLGKHPGTFSPPVQTNGESSDAMARKHIDNCITNGSARFDWLACAPDGREIPMEVMLTRIEWSGRQIIQAFITDISERQRAQSALAESEALFSAAFEASPILIVIARMSDQKYVLVNDAFVNWSGCVREELLGRDSNEFGIWESQDERDAVWTDLRRDGSIHERECRFRNRRGDATTMLISFEVIQINHAPHVLAMGLDITGRKRAEEASSASEARLRESEARFSAAFHASPAFLGILSLSDGKYVLVNEAYLNWLGYPPEEVVGHTCLELRMWENPNDRDLLLNDMHAFGSIRQRELRWRNRLGERCTVLLSAETIKLDDTPHMLIMAVDITKRKRSEEELRESEARLRESEARFSAAFHASPIITAIFRASDAKLVLVNDAFLNWSGYSRDEVLGHTTVELGIWEDPARRDRFWDEVLRAGSVREWECRSRNRSGKVSTMLASGVIIEINGVNHLLTMVVDISQSKEAEAELRRTLAREKELSQLKSNFVSMVSHEFRTPLGIIQSSAELLRDFFQKMPPGEREEQLESITRNTRRMAGMMEEILVLSRLDAGKLDFQPATLDLNAFCRRVLDEVLSATNRRCPIQLLLGPVPEPAQADERLLGHIFTNLLSNAVKYSEPGTTVRFAVEQDGPDAVCIIRDQGIGISEEDRQHLFKAFHRGSNVGTRPGTGLGLLVVKRCADLHGGQLQLNSKLGEGTTVTVRLPVFGTNHEKNIGH